MALIACNYNECGRVHHLPPLRENQSIPLLFFQFLVTMIVMVFVMPTPIVTVSVTTVIVMVFVMPIPVVTVSVMTLVVMPAVPVMAIIVMSLIVVLVVTISVMTAIVALVVMTISVVVIASVFATDCHPLGLGFPLRELTLFNGSLDGLHHF